MIIIIIKSTSLNFLEPSRSVTDTVLGLLYLLTLKMSLIIEFLRQHSMTDGHTRYWLLVLRPQCVNHSKCCYQSPNSLCNFMVYIPISVTECSRAQVCGRSPAWGFGFESHRGHGGLSVVSAVSWRSLRRADHLSTWVLLTVVRRCVWSRNLAISNHWWLQLNRRRITGCISYMPLTVTVKTTAECFRTDCKILGDKIKNVCIKPKNPAAWVPRVTDWTSLS